MFDNPSEVKKKNRAYSLIDPINKLRSATFAVGLRADDCVLCFSLRMLGSKQKYSSSDILREKKIR